MDEQMIEVRKIAAELLGYAGDDAVGILRGDFDDKWDCLRVGKEVARVIAGRVAELQNEVVELWHQAPDETRSLQECLHMADDEYAKWVNPAALAHPKARNE